MPADEAETGNLGSRLELMISRLRTQRACLEYAARDLDGRDGTVLELGLGKGRTYDFLSKRLPGREIFAFDREIHAPADCVPDATHLILGDFRLSLKDFGERHGRGAALVHADIGSEKRGRDRCLATALAPLIDAVVRPGALVLCDRELASRSWSAIALPKDAGGWDYYLYRVTATGR